MNVQFDEYEEVLAMMVSQAKLDLMLTAAESGIDPLFIGAASRLDSFDHRPLQEAHDLIAASYRALFDRLRRLPFAASSGSVHAWYRDGWLTYARVEIADLCSDPDFSKRICESIVYAHEDVGYAAERSMKAVLRRRYGLSD